MCYVYERLGFTKTDLSRWSGNPYTTHATVKEHKLRVVRSAQALMGLSAEEAEKLANRAGLSLCEPEDVLVDLLRSCSRQQKRLIATYAVSERMLQYYGRGKTPTKQALMSIAVLMGMKEDQTQRLLNGYGFCLSKSLISDAVVRWFTQTNYKNNTVDMLNDINETLERMGLPMLMTKPVNRV